MKRVIHAVLTKLEVHSVTVGAESQKIGVKQSEPDQNREDIFILSIFALWTLITPKGQRHG
ncbi:hypothetical protein [Faecalispora anaeroviscerum]|uniref:hypothetical protein n=1 Tax=Faecalispora anaeroviscerum TaxID=2991836 RepID=UPI0024BABC19|nr:hypothetical protein [Faecalispora anaeroviscerum]